MIISMKKVWAIWLVCLLCVPALVFADISIKPFLIDVTLEPRESKESTIRIESTYPNRKAVLFATVNEISLDEDGDIKEFISPVMTDRTNSVTSWIEVSRGRIEVLPNEVVEIPLSVKVHPYAEPGVYHAFIGVVEAPKRYQAEELALQGSANGVVLKVVVPDDQVDVMRISSLTVDRFVSSVDEQQVLVTVTNSGDRPSAPVGELIFYNNRGIEVGSSEVNSERVIISPNQEQEFLVTVPHDVTIGKYKANLNLRYGTGQTASLYDTTTFFYIPWWYQLAFIFGLVCLLFLFFLLYRRTGEVASLHEHGDEVAMYVRDGHNKAAQDHDINLKNT